MPELSASNGCLKRAFWAVAATARGRLVGTCGR